ncbi:hypothetical protein [Rhodococcus sp. NPDC058485]
MNTARTIGTAAAAVGIATGLAVGAAPAASADVPLQWVSMGPDIWTFSNSGACSGTIPMHLETSPARPGFLTFHFLPQGQLANPGCVTSVEVEALTGLNSQTRWVQVDGRPTSIELFTGSGVSLVSAKTPNLNKGVSSWVIVR